MDVLNTTLPGVLLLQPQAFEDERGFFMESYNQRRLNALLGRSVPFVQDNHSASRRGVLRGLHYQCVPAMQAKLVRVVVGEVFDVAVDVRRDSPTCGQWVGVYLSAVNRHQLWIPEGFAHGFLALSEHAELLYKTTDFYSVQHERCLLWNDPKLAIAWPLQAVPQLSSKDQQGRAWEDAELL